MIIYYVKVKVQYRDSVVQNIIFCFLFINLMGMYVMEAVNMSKYYIFLIIHLKVLI